MKGVNKCIIIGNLGNDPEIRFTQSGVAMATLSVATDESYKDKQTGQMVPKTEWHRCVCGGKIAEICQSYLKKGSKIYIEGKLQTRKWQDNNGQDRYTTEIKFFEMQMLDSKEQGASGGQPQQQTHPNRGQASSQPQASQQRPLQQQPQVNQQQPNPRDFQAPPVDDFDSSIPF